MATFFFSIFVGGPTLMLLSMVIIGGGELLITRQLRKHGERREGQLEDIDLKSGYPRRVYGKVRFTYHRVNERTLGSGALVTRLPSGTYRLISRCRGASATVECESKEETAMERLPAPVTQVSSDYRSTCAYEKNCLCGSGGNTMIQVTVLFGQPQDSAVFDRYYREAHAPLAKKLPGLKGYTSNKPASINPQEPSPYYLIDTLYFENREVLQATFQSLDGQAVAADLPKLATGGVAVLIGELEVYHPVAIS